MKKSELRQIIKKAIKDKRKLDSKLQKKIKIINSMFILENKEGVIMEVFLLKENAEMYRKEQNNGYYKDCKIKETKKNLQHWFKKAIDVGINFGK